MDVDTDFCAMCGHDWCSVRISKEIQDWASGKAEGFERGKPKISAALTDEQKKILEQRGVLTPEEIHKLAHKGKTPGKAVCHTDNIADAEKAKQVQEELVQLDTRPAHGLSKQESVV
jgi:phosphomethylpyrimidine synthase